MNEDLPKHYLIIEGGGFKTGFTAGIADAFLAGGFDPFDGVIGVSGGAVTSSYFLAKQHRFTLEAMLILARDKNFLNFKRTFGQQGYMDIDVIAKVAKKKVPFDLEAALDNSLERDIRFVATHRSNGEPYYLVPTSECWIDKVVASCTLPFVTKGKHQVGEEEFFDGGWSDGLPAKWAYEQGATHLTILRTWPADTLATQSWADYFGSLFFRSNPGLALAFQNNYLKYNENIEFINNPPEDLIIDHIYPAKLLRSSTYSYSKATIMSDYRYGLDLGIQHLMKFQ